MEVDSDSQIVVSLINEEPHVHSPHKILILECKALMPNTGCTLKQTLWDGNKVADTLANKGVN